ncbi:hypothetical protein NHQ30_011562 [Ciborinia camelliae]|nr:hypothetical protein NHQ30_011562 [Ciborinia camelliae]
MTEGLFVETLDISQLNFSDTYPVSGSTGMNPRLTFGVEFEMAVATLKHQGQSPEPEDSSKVFGVTHCVNPAPLDKNPTPKDIGQASQEESTYRTKNLLSVYEKIVQTLDDAGFLAVHTENPEYQTKKYTAAMTNKWIIGTDQSIRCPDENIYDYHMIEITSPVYYFGEEALSAVTKVWELMNSTYKLDINDSMGLHVHVGNGVDAFDGETLRNLWAILWTTGSWIDTIHSPHRKLSTFCKSFHDCSNILCNIEGQSLENREVEALEWILTRAPPTVEEFLNTIREQVLVDGAYNFNNLLPSNNTGSIKRTIEFRQHEATLDAEQVTQWVRLCVGLVKASAAADPIILDPYLRSLVQKEKEKIHVGDILKQLGLETSGVYYRAHVPRDHESASKNAVKKLWKRLSVGG